MSLSFGSNRFLLGVLFALIPIVLHLIWRKRAPQVFFPTVRFIKLAVQMTSRRKRVQNLLLLIMRTLMFALVPFGLADPRIPIGNRPQAPTAIAIVMDNSYSMGAEDEGRVRYERARQMAGDIISKIGAGSECALFFTNGSHGKAEGLLTPSTETLTTTLDASRVEAGRADIQTALQAAYEALAKSKLPNREIVVASDMQRISWDFPEIENRPEDYFKTPILVLDVGSASYRNLALSDVKVTGPLGSREGRSVTAEVFNASADAVKDCVVSLLVEDQMKAQRTVDVPSGGKAAVSFPLDSVDVTARVGKVVLPPDSLKVDNVRYFSLGRTRTIPVLLVRDQEPEAAFLDPAFYVTRALNPGMVLGNPRISNILPKAVTVEEISAVELQNYDVVFLLDVSKITTVRAEALELYVSSGGGLVVMPGDHVQPGVYQEYFGRNAVRKASLMPVMKDTPVEQKSFKKVVDVELNHPALDIFKSAEAAFFESVHVYKYFAMESSAGRAIAKLEGDAGPFLLEQAYDKGRVFFFAIPPDREWSNFTLTPAFPVLLVQLVNYLSAGVAGPSDFLVDAKVTFPAARYENAEAIVITLPDDTRKQVPLEGAVREVQFPETFMPGIYSYAPSSGRGPEGIFVVNVDAAESDLVRFDKDLLRKRFEGVSLFFASEPDQALALVQQLREGVRSRLSTYFLIAALIVALAEGVYSNLMRPQRGSQEPSDGRRRP